MELLKERTTALRDEFTKRFGTDAEGIRVFRSPGRVNLIGEHTDYNGGLVFPGAIDYSTLLLAKPRTDNTIRLESTDYGPGASVTLDSITPVKGRWADYPLGVVVELQKAGKTLGGLDLLFSSNVPSGAGLSSSASIEMAMAVALNAIFGLGMSQVELVKLSQAAENKFVGVNCGIMDQYAVGMGKEGSAFVLDCKTIEHRYVSAKLEGYTLMVINTNKKRGLADSKYNERRAQCEAGLADLKKSPALADRDFLGEITVEEYEANKHLITDEIVRNRVEHVIYEDARVLACMEAFAKGDAQGVAAALKGSHESLRDLYGVTGIELDTLYSEGLKCPGALAVRMTGAGFGGCAMAYVATDSIDAFETALREAYTGAIGYEPSFYRVALSDGAGEVTGI